MRARHGAGNRAPLSQSCSWQRRRGPSGSSVSSSQPRDSLRATLGSLHSASGLSRKRKQSLPQHQLEIKWSLPEVASFLLLGLKSNYTCGRQVPGLHARVHPAWVKR